MGSPAPELVVTTRFRGPARSGNGGYTAGSLADRVASSTDCPVVEVTLRLPPPLDVPMQVEQRDGVATVLTWNGTTVAEARETDTVLEPVDPVSVAEATDAMARYRGLVSHPFPTCFGCGTGRAEGDGLRIFPGPVGDHRVASLWVPHESVAEFSDLLDEGVARVGVGTAWAALDCVGGWTGDIGERLMVLGRMTAQVDALPVIGEPHVVIGEGAGTDGRKTFSTSTIYDSDGRVVGRAHHVWIAVDSDAFN